MIVFRETIIKIIINPKKYNLTLEQKKVKKIKLTNKKNNVTFKKYYL